MDRTTFRSILVGVEEPRQRRQPAVRRAAELARRTGGRLTLFHGAFSPLSVGPAPQGVSRDRHEARTIATLRAALEKLAAPLRQRGLKVTTRVAWDYPPYEAIVREALRSIDDAPRRKLLPGDNVTRDASTKSSSKRPSKARRAITTTGSVASCTSI